MKNNHQTTNKTLIVPEHDVQGCAIFQFALANYFCVQLFSRAVSFIYGVVQFMASGLTFH